MPKLMELEYNNIILTIDDLLSMPSPKMKQP